MTPKFAASRMATGCGWPRGPGDTSLRAKITDRVSPGVVYTTFHHPDTQANVITTDYSDWATNCPEYKVTAVQVSPSNGPSDWQEDYADAGDAVAAHSAGGGMMETTAPRLALCLRRRIVRGQPADAARGGGGCADLQRHDAGGDDGNAGRSGGFRGRLFADRGHRATGGDREHRRWSRPTSASMCRSGCARRPRRGWPSGGARWPGRSVAGLCGIDSLEEAMRELPSGCRASAFRLTPAQVCAAVAALPACQPLARCDARGPCGGVLDAGGRDRRPARGCRAAQCAGQAGRGAGRSGTA